MAAPLLALRAPKALSSLAHMSRASSARFGNFAGVCPARRFAPIRPHFVYFLLDLTLFVSLVRSSGLCWYSDRAAEARPRVVAGASQQLTTMLPNHAHAKP